MTSSKVTDLNIRKNANPKWDSTRCPEGGVSVVCWLAASVAMPHGNHPESGNNVKNSNNVQLGNKVTI